MSRIDMQSLNVKVQTLNQAIDRVSQSVQSNNSASFDSALKAAIKEVNLSQIQAENLKNDYTLGKNVSLEDVMMASQKANLNFQATLQIRNKLVSAYQEIMNMSV